NISASFMLPGGGTFSGSGTGRLILSGNIIAMNSVGLGDAGFVTTISGANSIAVGIGLNDGATIEVGSSGAFNGPPGALFVGNGVTLRALTGFTIARSVQPFGLFVIDTNGFNVVISPLLLGSNGPVRKIGSGQLKISCINSAYSGGLEIQAGEVA